jgi:hypothetical protein
LIPRFSRIFIFSERLQEYGRQLLEINSLVPIWSGKEEDGKLRRKRTWEDNNSEVSGETLERY